MFPKWYKLIVSPNDQHQYQLKAKNQISEYKRVSTRIIWCKFRIKILIMQSVITKLSQELEIIKQVHPFDPNFQSFKNLNQNKSYYNLVQKAFTHVTNNILTCDFKASSQR